jgi:predicted methyltransferase
MRGIVLSYSQAQKLLDGRQVGHSTIAVSLDLGLTSSQVKLEDKGVHFPDGQSLTWPDVETVSTSERVCFAVEENEIRKIQIFSEMTNQLYSLMPTQGAPTMLISGIPMHRIKGIDPYRDTHQKIAAIVPVTGHVLDTATGLGYTAIEAAKTADHVTTIELNPTTLEIARLNPWSQDLFHNPRISQLIGDSFEQVGQFEDGTFSRIIHDPPTFSLAGELYSGEFYRRLFRVLGRGGRVFHYIGDLQSKSGKNVSRGVMRRLQEAGFSRVIRRPQAFGLVAFK